jgi:hypothetical protein
VLGTRETSTAYARGRCALRRGLAGGAFALAAVIGAPATAVGGYGGEPPPSAPPPPMSASGPMYPAGGAIQGQAALAQLALYQQYLLYVAVASTPPAKGPPPDVGQYFTNGAVVTTVPSASQPGGAYFANGAEATRLPLTPSVGSAAASAAPPARSAPLPSFWWVEPDGKQAAPPPPPSAAPSPPPSPAGQPLAPAPEAESPGAPMSFEEWLQSMGAVIPEAQAAEESSPVPTDEEAAPVAEPSATANDVRQRGTYAAREKPRERVATSGTSKGLAAVIFGAFGVGLLMGVLAMRRARVAMGTRSGGAAGEIAQR